jgi:transposase-like protein
MISFSSLSSSLRKAHLDRLQSEHQVLRKKEKALAFSNRPACPYCNQTHVHSVGFRDGINHYRCTSCKKSYSARTGTSFYWIHLRQKFDLYMQDMLTNGHKPLKQMCKTYNISLITAFDWRHKILAALNCSPKQFKGLIELRNSAYRFSRKGIKSSKSAKNAPEWTNTPVQLLITADYSNNMGIDIARIGKLKGSDIETHLAKRIDKDHVIVSPYSKGIQEFAKTRKLAITTFSKRNNPHELDDKKTKLLNEKLKQLIIEKTRGVSTKYLQHYSRWLLISQTEANLKQISHEVAQNTSAWTDYTDLEIKYQQFLSHFSSEPYIQTSSRKWKSKIFSLNN